jgi:hypothetical protein
MICRILQPHVSKPVSSGSTTLHVTVDSNPKPVCEVKDYNSRSAMLWIQDDVPAGGAVEIKVQKPLSKK